MRKVVMIITAVASILVAGIVAFEAHATMGAGTQSLAASAKSYSQVQEASCDGQGMFCRQGSYLRCNPFCVCEPCSKRVKVQKPKR
jgi:hypothetical protein